MNRIPIHVERATDQERFLATDHTVWFLESPAAPTEDQLVGLPPDRRFAAHVEGADPGTYPGIYGVFPLTLAIPGPSAETRHLSCAGLTWVGVHPDHRRRGVLTAMLRHHLEQVHEDPDVHVSALHASEPAIYGRFGYGLASLEHEVTLSRGTKLTAPHLEDGAAGMTTQFVTLSDPGVTGRLRDCHLELAEPGSVVGEIEYYERIGTEFPEHLREKERLRVLFARRGGHDVGFAVFRRRQKWERARPSGELVVWALVGEPAARLALLRRLVDFDLVGAVKVGNVGVDDPLLRWVGGPRGAVDVATYDNLWIRLVDLPQALAARAWSAPCDLVVEVSDPAAPWNEGTWRIHAEEGGSATVERSTAVADLHVGVDALGSAYLGGGNVVALQRAGLVTERSPGAAVRLWRALRTDLAPAAAIGF
ncbi:acetyltransferase [Intrasporangium oryzae NRRL B-24470]|uniref:Acetyltransferase n=1 Tax=Intrasporangium oryzae NRRL B-24470 TaxID=1386089 RepID=W9G8V8_9MICO|nr:GNAT family N-acetyltransferase [Intrasporangium oryzae]EWT01687.1 acetyltransferase [Intrasporangium oryzae NRRL B-24470]